MPRLHGSSHRVDHSGRPQPDGNPGCVHDVTHLTMGSGDDEPDVELDEPFEELQKNRRCRRIEEGDGPGVEYDRLDRVRRRSDEL